MLLKPCQLPDLIIVNFKLVLEPTCNGIKSAICNWAARILPIDTAEDSKEFDGYENHTCKVFVFTQSFPLMITTIRIKLLNCLLQL